MNGEPQVVPLHPLKPERLWFGSAGAAFVWFAIEMVNVALAWEACTGGLAGTGVFTQSGMRTLLGVLTFISLGIAVLAGLTSYWNFRTVCRDDDLASTEARDRREFMSLVGMVVSISLGIGIIWFILPIFILNVCGRVH